MKSINGLAIRYEEGRLEVLNQQKLPQEEEWLCCETPQQMVEMIISLKVRGAPMIGLAAILSLAQYASRGADAKQLIEAAMLLRSSRPTAVNLSIYLDRVLCSLKKDKQSLFKAIEEIYNEDATLCQSMGEWGASLIKEEEALLTYCNTGSLATAGIGTALGIIKTAYRQGKNIHVFVPETRPLLQGGRLTAWELKKENISHTLICDNMVGHLMSMGKIDRVLVGADRIGANGDFANKIGTYSLAILAHFHRIPFHVVAPYTTYDPNCLNGAQIIIEQRAPDEVRGAKGGFGQVIWSPADCPVYNPSFDVTPGKLVTSFILDKGVFSSIMLKNL